VATAKPPDERSLWGSVLDYTLYRLVVTNPTTVRDFLSQAARKQPTPRRNPPSQHDWEGLSMFTSYEAVRKLGVLFKWKHGEWVAVLRIPDTAPLTIEGPDRHHALMV
jgi:hypothetical protein